MLNLTDMTLLRLQCQRKRWSPAVKQWSACWKNPNRLNSVSLLVSPRNPCRPNWQLACEYNDKESGNGIGLAHSSTGQQKLLYLTHPNGKSWETPHKGNRINHMILCPCRPASEQLNQKYQAMSCGWSTLWYVMPAAGNWPKIPRPWQNNWHQTKTQTDHTVT